MNAKKQKSAIIPQNRAEIRFRYPQLARRADRGSAIAKCALFCTESMGGSRHDAAKCEVRDCALWDIGPAGRRARRIAKKAASGMEGS
jgi:hypothetical protein